jgi:cell division septum initiation protein DivIVA
MIDVSHEALFMLTAGAFGYVFIADRIATARTDRKANKDEVIKLQTDVAHITDRVDSIYDHLIAKQQRSMKRKKANKDGR